MTTVAGVLIAESLRLGLPLEGTALSVEKIYRADAGDVSRGQPRAWTFIHFEAPSDGVQALVDALSETIDPRLGWYCDFRSTDETFVVFAGRAFRYPRGDVNSRREAEDHARSVGVPEAQIDWAE